MPLSYIQHRKFLICNLLRLLQNFFIKIYKKYILYYEPVYTEIHTHKYNNTENNVFV